MPSVSLMSLSLSLSWSLSFASLLLLYALASVACFVLYASDKAAARSGRRRTPERTLLLAGLTCGWPGALLAQQTLRHKSRKPAFLLKFWLTVLLNLALLAALVTYAALPGWW